MPSEPTQPDSKANLFSSWPAFSISDQAVLDISAPNKVSICVYVLDEIEGISKTDKNSCTCVYPIPKNVIQIKCIRILYKSASRRFYTLSF